MGSGRELLERFGSAITGEQDLESFLAPDVEYHDSMSNVSGVAGVAEYLKSWYSAFPDARVTVSDVIESGDQAVGRMNYRGTHTGTMSGPAGDIPATGKSVSLDGAAWITIRDGKIARFDGYYDTMSMMVQLGLMPAPAMV